MEHAVKQGFSVTLPSGKTTKLLAKYWHLAASIMTLAVSVGVAKGKYSSTGDRLGAVEQAQPAVTAALTQRNANELGQMRQRMDQLSSDVAGVRVDVARLVTAFGLQPHRDAEGRGDIQTHP